MTTTGTSIAAGEEPKKLQRGLRLLDATMLVVGSMIGSGIFMTSAESARLVGAPGWLLVAWLAAGVMTITGALCVAELAAMMPRAGGPYVFLSEAYHPAMGFLYGWSQFLIIQTGTIAAVAVAFANFAGVLLPQISSSEYWIEPIVWGRYALSLSTQQVVAVGVIVVLTVINARGLESGKRVQNFLTVIKTAALFALIVLGFTVGWNADSAASSSAWWDSQANGWSLAAVQPGAEMLGAFAFVVLIGRAMTGPLFSQSAWDNVTFAAGEVEQPGRNLPRALLAGCAIVVGLYLLANVAYVVTLPLADIQQAPQNRVAAVMMERIAGPAGTTMIAIAIMLSTFGCNNGLILSGARVSFAMARDGLFLPALAKTNRRNVPAAALFAQCGWACLLVLPRTVTYPAESAGPVFGNVYTQLLEYIVSVDLVFSTLAVLAVIALRRRIPEAPRPYRTWGYPFTPLLFLTFSSFLIVVLAISTPATAGVGYLLALSAFPVYGVTRLLAKRRASASAA